MKKLYRSSTNNVVAGIIGGFGEYWDIDPVVLRLGFVFLILITGLIPGVLAYLIALLIVPKPTTHIEPVDTPNDSQDTY